MIELIISDIDVMNSASANYNSGTAQAAHAFLKLRVPEKKPGSGLPFIGTPSHACTVNDGPQYPVLQERLLSIEENPLALGHHTNFFR